MKSYSHAYSLAVPRFLVIFLVSLCVVLGQGVLLAPTTQALTKKEANQLKSDLKTYKNKCKDYDPSKDKNNKTCKNVRNRLTNKGGCNFGNKKANNNRLNRCEARLNNAIKAADSARLETGAQQSSVNLNPIKRVGVENPGEGTVNSIVNIVFGIAGSLAVLFVVIGGMRYVISRGDPQSTAQAKNTILYALIGLIVTIFAFAIVRFVISRLT